MELNQITGSIVDAAMKVHTALGPGLLESVYEKCLKHELTKRGFHVQSQLWLPVIYDGIEMEGGYKIDLLVEEQVIVELKVVEQIIEVHKASIIVLSETSRQAGRLVDQFQRSASTRRNSQASQSLSILSVLCVLCGFGLTTVPFAVGRSVSAADSHRIPTTGAERSRASAFRLSL